MYVNVENPNTEYVRGRHDAISAMHGNFSEISLNKAAGYQVSSYQQPRSNQWNFPILDKDVTADGTTYFSRAPYTNRPSLTDPTSVTNMGNPLGLHTDGSWSTGQNMGDGWSDSSVSAVVSAVAANDNENNEWSVQEFRPGKPWKIKNIEDDPNATPGSVARSPLLINPTPKDADIFSNESRNSPTDLPPLSLSSSIWSFHPTASNPSLPSWSDNSQQYGRAELWATPAAMNKPTRGPPPGLMGTNKSAVGVGSIVNPNAVLNAASSNGWLSATDCRYNNGGGGGGVGVGVGGVGGTNCGVLLQNSSGNSSWNSSGAGVGGGGGSSNPSWNSNWLLLQNSNSQGPHGGVAGSAGGSQAVNAAAVSFGQGTANVAAATVNAAAAPAVTNSNNQPSVQQLRTLMQLPVNSGYLSNEIVNQLLAPILLLLLKQTNMKHLQGATQLLGYGHSAINLHVGAITQLQQEIQNLQLQINAHLVMFMTQQTIHHQQNAQKYKQQQQQEQQQQEQQQQEQQQQEQQQQGQPQHPNAVAAAAAAAAGGHVNYQNTEYMRGPHDAISALQGNFSEISLNKAAVNQTTTNQQLRSNQWNLSVLDKDVTVGGTTDYYMGGPLGLQTDGTWSTGRSVGDGWPDSSVSTATSTVAANDNENKDWSAQDFEPGKPCKIKNIEDDRNATPGSVARSPLSINPTTNDADILSNESRNSPTDLPPLSLSSSIWSFHPTASNPSLPSRSDNSQQYDRAELWATLAAMKKPTSDPCAVLNVASSNSWPSITAGRRNNGSRGVGGCRNSCSSNPSWNSNWLLLKNLNKQTDRSILRRLCIEHGSPMKFHVYLNHRIAVCKYVTCEEAKQAQMALNNRLLGHTRICAELPSEAEVQNICYKCSNIGDKIYKRKQRSRKLQQM